MTDKHLELNDLDGPITVVGGTASMVDATADASSQRFYRVVLIP